MAARHEELCCEENIFMYFLGCKGLLNNDVAVARDTVFQEIRPGELVSKPAIFAQESWGGYRRTTL